jgi:hypothetical protein
MPNCWTINTWSMVIFSSQTIVLMCPSIVDFWMCKKNSNRFGLGIVYWTTNKPPTPTQFAHYHYLDPIQIHYNIFSISFGRSTILLHLLFSLDLIMN